MAAFYKEENKNGKGKKTKQNKEKRKEKNITGTAGNQTSKRKYSLLI
jgi:hypothetical protein